MFRFAHARVLALAAALFVFASAAVAQQAPLVGIDPIRATLDQVEAQARRSGLGVKTLQNLTQTIAPLRNDLRDKLADLEPRLADVDARLKGLGDPPAANAPPENPAIAAERARLMQQRAELDAAVKQVQLLQARADQLSSALNDRRRSAYAETLFQRSPNVLDPYFWGEVIAAIPDEAERLIGFARSWWVHARDHGGRARALSAAITFAALAVFVVVFARWWRRMALIGRVGTRYGKALAALLAFVRLAFALPAAVFVILELLEQFELVPADTARVAAGLIFGTAIAALARASAVSVLAPDDPQRRLVAYDDATAQWLTSHLVWGGRLFGALIIFRALHRTVGGPAVIDVAVRMLFATSVVTLLVHVLIGGRQPDDETQQARRIPGVRLLAWVMVATILVSLLTGYAAFAAFVAGRVVFTLALVTTLCLLLIVTDAIINRTMSPDSTGGRTLARQLGIEPRRLALFGKVASGLARALFVLVVIGLAIGRWEIATADLLEGLRGVAFGIRIGDFTISFGAVFGAIALFLVIALLTRLIQGWLEREVMPHTAIEPSLQLSIVTILGYIGYIIALVVALAEIGIDPQKIALVAGALSVGIGFGLQSIVSNFVSGLILLAERPIRVGDQINVKGDEGFVRRISVRATEIETFDKASVIVPNSELITGVVKNWTHANTLGRINIKVSVSYGCDAEQAMAILKECTAEHPDVLKQPPPAVQLSEFGATAMSFDIFCIVPNLSDRGRIKSDIQLAILRRFREAGIDMTPAQDVRLIGGAPNAGATQA
jgi:potassium-dependent mechanosensitive channel